MLSPVILNKKLQMLRRKVARVTRAHFYKLLSRNWEGGDRGVWVCEVWRGAQWEPSLRLPHYRATHALPRDTSPHSEMEYIYFSSSKTSYKLTVFLSFV